MKKLLVILFLSFAFYFVKGQCHIDILKPTADTTICEGDSLELNSDGSCTFLMNNSFDNGQIGTGWYSTQANPVFNNPCGPGPNGAHLWVGTTPSQTRTLVTQSYDVSSTSCMIKWWMRYGRVQGSGPCEDPDASTEGVHLQYSTNNGANWTDFPGPDVEPVGNFSTTGPFTTQTPGSGGYWQPYSGSSAQSSSELYYWNRYENSVPAAAATTNTQFRWAQLANSSQGWDAWGIDEVEIYCPGMQNVAWSHGVSNFYGGWVSPTSTTSYTVYILDTSGNSANASVNVTVTPTPDPGLGPDTTICNNPGNYAILEADSGYDSYLWNTSATTQSINVSQSGTYWVTVTKGNCTATDSVNVTVTPAPTADAGQDVDICIGDSTTLSAATVSGFYAWSTGDSTQSITVSPTQDTNYILKVGSSPDCVAYDTVNVTVHPLPNADAGQDEAICNGAQVDLSASGGQDYAWSTGDMVSTITVSPGTTTEYHVTVTDIHGCVYSDTVEVEVYPLPVVTVTALDSAVCLGEETELTADGATSYSWSNGMSGQNIIVTPMTTTTFTATGTDDNGCKSTGSATVIAEDCSTFFIPNAFSPNGDNVNDVFQPLGDFAAIDEYELQIYDRWGNVIYNTQDPSKGWDGTIEGEVAPHGVYVYRVYYKSVWGKEFTKSGSVTLLK
ncbi:MAG: gliding motility-associated C-terminal domain-containing protein [Bacteroidales bacterium]